MDTRLPPALIASLAERPGYRPVAAIIARLRAAGHQAFLCGGAVRDALLGRPPKDFDVVTDAVPDRVEALFPRTVAVGKAFGVICVVQEDVSVEVATFRADGAYSDGRRPDDVRFGSLEEDVLRRDFTVNGLLLDPVERRLIDRVGGRADLDARVIRAIGDAGARFDEDHLRMLRAVRFACQLDFSLDPATAAAIGERAPKLAAISAERITEELSRMLGGPAPGRALRLLREHGLLAGAMPGLAEQPDAVLALAARALDRLPHASLSTALAALLTPTPEAVAEAALDALVLPTAVRREAQALIGDARDLEALRVAPVAARKRALRQPHAAALLDLARALALADDGLLDGWHALRLDRQRWLAEGSLAPAPLLDGRALMELGVPRGPRVGELLRRLEDAQLEGRVDDVGAARALVRAALEVDEGSA